MTFAGLLNDPGKNASLVPVRLALGASMVYHGTAKLRGEGPEQTGQMFEQLGVRPGKRWAVATGLAETFAGVAAILGIATRPAAIAVLVTQAVAISKVHAPKGFDVMKGGMEFNLALMAIASALLLSGPGRVSAHGVVSRRANGRDPKRLFRKLRPTLATRLVEWVA
jgi:putative oxidoreductase